MELNCLDSDVLIRCTECGLSNDNLGTLIDEQLEFIEKNMCEENAKDIYVLMVNLQIETLKVQKWYDKWKAMGFEKIGDERT